MKLSRLTVLIFQLNGALDAGASMSIAEAQARIRNGTILPWLREEYPQQFVCTSSPEEDREITGRLRAIYEDEGDGRKRWLVHQNGLCLLLAWVVEMIQAGPWELDRWTEATAPSRPRRRGPFGILERWQSQN